MKNLYAFLLALLIAGGSYAQCVIDPSNLPNPAGGMYPVAAQLHHIVRDSLYDQTIQVRIPDTSNINFGGFISIDLRIDSVRLDSLQGLPNGINWSANPTVLLGGGFGCGQFTGTTSDTAGRYNLVPIGMAWAHLSAPLLGINVDTFQYGPLDRFPAFRNYYVVVDSAQLPLSVTTTVVHLCDSAGFGAITAHASGGSAIAPYTYLWNTGATSYTINNLATESYSLTVTSGAETVTTTVDVTVDPPILLSGSSDSAIGGNNGSAWVNATGGTPPYRYFWSGGAGNTDTVTGLAPGTYRVTVRDSFNCVARDTFVVEGTTGVLTVGNEAPKLSLFPNPANNLMTVSIEALGNFTGKMEAIDVTGRIIFSAPISVNAGRYSRSINTEQFSSGVYVLQITSKNKSVQQRFVVNH